MSSSSWYIDENGQTQIVEDEKQMTPASTAIAIQFIGQQVNELEEKINDLWYQHGQLTGSDEETRRQEVVLWDNIGYLQSHLSLVRKNLEALLSIQS